MTFLNKKNLSLILAIGVLMFTLIGGFYLYNSQPAIEKRDMELQKKQEQQKPSNQDVDNKAKKDETSNNQVPSGGETKQPDQPNQVTPTLKDVGLQASLDKTDYGIIVKLYGPEGVYTVEKKVANAWVGVKSNVAISGKLTVDLGDKIPVSETERTYRIYLIIGGKKIGPKEILIDRNLVVSSGGVTNFPGAL